MSEGNDRKVPIFNIVHGSFVDGYGIRSTIFLKGCPLRCKWCCNPEGQLFTNQLQFIESHCNGCGRCIEVCPKQAISKDGEKIAIDWSKCDDCGICITKCWQDALKPAAKEYTAEEIFTRILREKPYYDKSGGGLTIGGGEATCYPEFCLELIRLCHDADINVAIDTCGYLVKENSKQVLLEADLLLFDLKGIDAKRHKENTGVSNETILSVFQEMTEAGKTVIVRLPIIPGYNDSAEELEQIAKLLQGKKSVKRVDLMPYHDYGKSKYPQLGMVYPIPDDVTFLSPNRVNEILTMFQKYGLNVQIGG